jgi:putative MATE family efflux protein
VIQPTLRIRTESFLNRHFTGEAMDYRRILAIFVPVLVDQAFVTCMNLLNAAMISSSGPSAIAAVSMVDQLNFFFVSAFIAVSTGGTVVVAQFKGHGDEKQVAMAAAGSISTVFLLALVIALPIIAFHGSLLKLLFSGATPEVLGNAQIYIIGSCASYCGIAVEESVCGALRGVGQTRSTLALSFIMNLSYVLLNLLFINVLHMGVLGMAISINISRYLAAACAITYLSKWDNPVHFRFKDMLSINFPMLRKIFYIGIPFASEQMFFNGGKILTQTFIVSLGTFAMAANAICSSLGMLFQIPSLALVTTAVTVVGQSVGSCNIRDARKFIRSFLVLSSASCVLMAALLMPLLHPLIALFHPPPEIVSTIVIIVWINTAAQILLWPISFLTPSTLRAAGDSRFTSVVAMLSMWLFRVVLGYVLGIVLKFGIIGVWVAMDCEWAVRGSIFFARFRGEKWYKHRLVE